LPHISSTNYIPKTAAVLTLIKEILERHEQVCVFSAFNDPNDYLSQLLGEAKVRHLVLDGRTSQKKRGHLASVFKAGRNHYHDAAGRRHQPIPVTLAGVDSMAEGHSFHRCNNVILFAYSWAYDKFKQALDRVHRLNSEKPINVYVVFCDGTIDARLESLTDEKADSAELVLDGSLMGERAEEVNFAQLLRVAQSEFNPADQTIDEGKLLQEWPALRAALSAAQQSWDAALPQPAMDIVANLSLAPSLPLKTENLKLNSPSWRTAPILCLAAEAEPPVQTSAAPLKTENLKLNTSPNSAWLARFRTRTARLAELTA